MVGHQQPIFVDGGAHQREPQQRRGAQVEPVGRVGGDEVRERLCRLVGGGQVDLPPAGLGVVEHDLPWARRRLDERHPQVLVPVDECLCGGMQSHGVHLAGQRQLCLHGVGVGGVGVVLGVEQQAELQRRQRPDVGEALVAALPPIDLALVQFDEREVRRRVATGGSAGVGGQRGQRLRPQVGELANVVLRENLRGVAERDGQLAGGVGDGVDVEHRRQRHGGVLGRRPAARCRWRAARAR